MYVSIDMMAEQNSTIISMTTLLHFHLADTSTLLFHTYHNTLHRKWL